MKIVFVRAATESLGLEYLSSALKARGHETALVYEPLLFDSLRLRLPSLEPESAKLAARRALAMNPGLIGFSADSDHFQWSLAAAREIKRLSAVPVIFGGVHASTAPEAVLRRPEVDLLCVADGERAIVELADRLESGQPPEGVDNIWSKKDGAAIKTPVRLENELDLLPFPDKDLFYREYPGFVRDTYSIVTGRGCPNACTYCHNSAMRRVLSRLGCRDRFFRRRNVKNVIAELRSAAKTRDFRRVSFCDDLFISDLAWLREFAEVYPKEIGLPFFCNIHPADAGERTVALLKAAGATAVNMGVQTISGDIRRECLGRAESIEAAEQALSLLKYADIFAYTNFIFGLPGQDTKELKAIAAFAAANPAGFHDVNWLRYYPGTAILENARKEGFVSEKTARAVEDGEFSVPYGHGGHSYTPERARLRNMVFLASLLPRKAVQAMLARDLWKLLPAFSLRLPVIALRGLLAKFEGNPNPYPNFSLAGSLRYFLHYFFRLYFGRAFLQPAAAAAKRLFVRSKGALFLAGLLNFKRAARYASYIFKRRLLGRRVPGMAVFAATFSCQCSCAACSSGTFSGFFAGKTMERARALERARELAALGIPRIHFTGGEPTLVPYLAELVAVCADSGMTVFVETNGIGVTEELIMKLKHAGLACLNISLDSALPEIHDSVRKVPGCHEAAVKALNLCGELGQKCMVSCYATRGSAADGTLSELLARAFAAGAGAVRVLPPVASGGWADKFEELRLELSDRQAVADIAFRARGPVLDRTALIDCELCSAYKIMVLPDSSFAPCEHLPFIFKGSENLEAQPVITAMTTNVLFREKAKCWPRDPAWRKAHPEAAAGKKILYLGL
ncbi:MAG: radical SAM protein [Elusimicrobia bacterium]|nr:radical SAM protein [Elusimicrobiota bacterium]